MNQLFTLLLAIICMINLSCQSAANDQLVALNPESEANTESILDDTSGKSVEMVFCLDATGSMGGLIATAKEKIWSIVSEMAQENFVKDLKLGMVFYRDRGDNFITYPISMTTDLDSVYSELLLIGAQGGGDSPESVNQALHEAITKMRWNEDKSTYKTIFVVGDCPPHMDYQDDMSYLESCEIAAEKGININTIKLGNSCEEAIPHFQKMAECSNGNFLQLDQNASDIVIETPYDEEINEVSRKIDESRMYYGYQSEKNLNNIKKGKSLDVYNSGSLTSNSDRASYKNSKAGRKAWMGNKEMIKDYSDSTVVLSDLSIDELPDELKDLSKTEQEVLLRKKAAERKTNETLLDGLTKKRQGYIINEKEKNTGISSFSNEVIKIMKTQANTSK